MFRYSVLVAALLCAGLPVQAQQYPEYAGHDVGRTVWLDNCEGCHAYGVAGAPLAGNAEVWTPRIEKGKAVLYEHALEGFFGPGGTMMPARGGNDLLTDAEVKSAVDYMVRLAAPE